MRHRWSHVRPAFLPRLRTIIESAEAVITNEVGSHVLYSVHLQRPVRIVPQDIDYVAAPEVLERDGATPQHWQGETIRTTRELFQHDTYTLTQQQTDFVSVLTGRSSRRSRVDMKEILTRAEDRYREQPHDVAADASLGTGGGSARARAPRRDELEGTGTLTGEPLSRPALACLGSLSSDVRERPRVSIRSAWSVVAVRSSIAGGSSSASATRGARSVASPVRKYNPPGGACSTSPAMSESTSRSPSARASSTIELQPS